MQLYANGEQGAECPLRALATKVRPEGAQGAQLRRAASPVGLPHARYSVTDLNKASTAGACVCA